ncbi:MAG TPA: hypothetical protein VIF10_04925 [Methylobacter sp.]|jgi:hypothetical protein
MPDKIMHLPENKKVLSWAAAFWLLFWKGGPDELGPNFRLKNTLANLALIWLIGYPVLTWFLSLDFAGHLPPEAPLIQATGSFSYKETHVGKTAAHYFIFATDNGEKYHIGTEIDPPMLDEIAKLNPPVKVYAEGFILRDGKGSYFPLKITAIDGTDLVPPDELMQYLSRGREPFVLSSMIIFLVIEAMLFLPTFFYMRELRAIYLQENKDV